MKKHQIAATVGVLALAANLLLPNLAFGQTQQGSVDVTCPGSIALTVSLVAAPEDVTFVSKAAPTSGTESTVDTNAGDFTSSGSFSGGNSSSGGVSGTRTAGDHLLRMTDTTSQGVEGCGGSVDKWKVAATITTLHASTTKSLVTSGDTDYINANTIKLVTTSKVDTTNITNGGPAIAAANSEKVFYDDYTSTGVGHTTVGDNKTSGTDFTTAGFGGGTYLSGNTLDRTALPVLTHCTAGATGENSDIYTGVALGIDSGIRTLQSYGTYSGTIEYTLSQGSGSGC